MKNLTIETSNNIIQIARNCAFYKREGLTNHFINEVGCLRGTMYMADIIGINYPKEMYYNLYINPAYEMMNNIEPFLEK